MSASLKIKKGDVVRIIAGKYKSKPGKINEGKVISVDVKNHKVTVEGFNMVKKHEKPNAQNQQGGIVEKEAPIDISNVALVIDGKITKVGYKYEENDGKLTKVRVAKAANNKVIG